MTERRLHRDIPAVNTVYCCHTARARHVFSESSFKLFVVQLACSVKLCYWLLDGLQTRETIVDRAQLDVGRLFLFSPTADGYVDRGGVVWLLVRI